MAYTETGDLSPKGLDSADNSSVTLQGFIKKLQPDFDKKFLLGIKPRLQYHQHGQKGVLLRNQGNIVKFVGYKPLSPIEQALPENVSCTNGHDLVRQKLETYEVGTKPKKFCGNVGFSHVEETIEAFKSALEKKIEIVASRRAAESIERLVRKKVGNGLLRRRADNNQDYQKDLTLIANATNDESTIIIPELIGSTVNWAGARVTFLSPDDPSYGITVQVRSFATADGAILFEDPLPVTPKVGTQFRICSCRNIISTANAVNNKLTSKVLRLAVRDLEVALAEPMQDGSYVCIIDPYTRYDFMDDTAWNDVSKYQDKANIYNGELGKMWNIRFVGVSRSYQENDNGDYVEGGFGTNNVHFATLLAQDAYGVVGLESEGEKIHVRDLRQLVGQPLPLSVEWEIMFETKILNATFGVNIACAVSN